jgi:hypothetical protein
MLNIYDNKNVYVKCYVFSLYLSPKIIDPIESISSHNEFINCLFSKGQMHMIYLYLYIFCVASLYI